MWPNSLANVVRKKLDAVDAHHGEEGEVAFPEVGLAVFPFHLGEFALEDFHEKIAAPASGLQKAGADAIGLVLHQIQHGLDHPSGRENLAVISDALFGCDEGLDHGFSRGRGMPRLQTLVDSI